MRTRVTTLALSVLLTTGPLDAEPKATAEPLAAGLAALEASDYGVAETALARVAGTGTPEAKLGLARAAFEQCNYADAEKYARDAAASSVHKVRAAILRAQVLEATGKVGDALKLLETVKTGKGSDVGRARLLLGEYRIEVGRRADASDPLRAVIDDYNDGTITAHDAEGLAQVGRAAFLLRSPKDANTAFKESERIDKKRVETLLWAAELFLGKGDPGHAEEELKDALAVAPKRADALIALARVKLDQRLDFEEADKLVARALSSCPTHAGALAVRAGLALRDMDIASAEKAVADGLVVHPTDLELLSLEAAIRFLDDDPVGFAAAKRRVLAHNREFSQLYGIIGDYAEWEHRYDEIIGMMKDATQLDPDDGKAWAQLGLTQMRSGDEPGGMESLKKAWSKDK